MVNTCCLLNAWEVVGQAESLLEPSKGFDCFKYLLYFFLLSAPIFNVSYTAVDGQLFFLFFLGD